MDHVNLRGIAAHRRARPAFRSGEFRFIDAFAQHRATKSDTAISASHRQYKTAAETRTGAFGHVPRQTTFGWSRQFPARIVGQSRGP